MLQSGVHALVDQIFPAERAGSRSGSSGNGENEAIGGGSEGGAGSGEIEEARIGTTRKDGTGSAPQSGRSDLFHGCASLLELSGMTVDFEVRGSCLHSNTSGMEAVFVLKTDENL
ncbi:hypothetical protein J5N97_005702 [Dioscorea zingiberensis]|uniref:Uncharacterized protein n=1 Tax=Dioscorea zingiberensis TaxID=325984 RepID=A0A9D5HSX7_9LILI|nr:hypothetical protein J5N97_005702 [Dioscorea zingiberensis]